MESSSVLDDDVNPWRETSSIRLAFINVKHDPVNIISIVDASEEDAHLTRSSLVFSSLLLMSRRTMVGPHSITLPPVDFEVALFTSRYTYCVLVFAFDILIEQV